MDTVREPLLVLDQDMRALGGSRSFYEVVGLCPEMVEGQLLFMLSDGRWDIPALRTGLESCLESGVAVEPIEIELDVAGTGRRTLLVDARKVFYESGSPDNILLAFEDVTERKQDAENLRLSEERFRSLFDAAPDAILVYEKDKDAFVQANAAAEKLFGISRDELLRLGPKHFYAPEQPDGRPVDESYAENDRAIDSGRESFFYRRIRDAAGNDHLCECRLTNPPSKTGRVSRVSYIDITQLQRAEDQLRANEYRFQSVANAIGEGIFISDVATGKYLYVNDAGAAMFGYRLDELVGTMSALVSDATAPIVVSETRSWMAAGPQHPQRFTWEIPAKDGRMVWVDAALRRTKIGGQDVVLSVLRDVTERRVVDEQLRQAQKMEAIGNLTGGMAHDFNNLLSIIIGNLDMLRDARSADAKVTELTDDAIEAALQGADLTKRLLAFARRQTLHTDRVEVNQLVTDTANLLRRVLGENIEISLDLGEEGCAIDVDSAQLQAALTNLATNARDAMPRGGRLSITTRHCVLDEAFAAHNAEVTPGSYTMIDFADTGRGIPPRDHRPHL